MREGTGDHRRTVKGRPGVRATSLLMTMKHISRPARILTGLSAIAFLAGRLLAADINVFAAVSLLEPLKEIAAAYQHGSGDKLVFNFGASSQLARQIEEGAPADVFFSADEAKMDALAKKHLVIESTRKSRLGNTLVIIVGSESRLAVASAKDLAGDTVKRLALAEPKSVPAGIYAKEYLTRQDLWTAVEPKVVPTENVRAALAAVESGNVDAAIVYRTDAAITKKAKVALEIPAADGPTISYPMALMKEAKQPEAARRFLGHLAGKAAGEVFQRHGFIVRE